MSQLTLPAPAKLNLFLHITGRRADGYHLLETCFQFLALADSLTFKVNQSGDIRLHTEIAGVAHEDNLIVKAARLMQAQLLQYAPDSQLGVDIELDKQLPMGGGLGGGSSNAATTLHALNKLWQLDLATEELETMGLKLGADVPIFVHGHAAFASGIGEQFIDVNPEQKHFLVVVPDCQVNTAEIFSDPALTRDSKNLRIRAPLSQALNWDLIGNLRNDCENLVKAKYPEINQALSWLNQHADARLTGTGSCIFAPFNFAEDASKIASLLPTGTKAFVTRGLNTSPLITELAR